MSLFLLFAPNLLREGMFVDGIWYATISNNLANGFGSLWKPLFTNTIFPEFYEHPPLVFWIQSLFFRIFGSSFWTERIYCLSIFILTSFLVIKIWKIINTDNPDYKKASYIPISLWMLNFQTFFPYPNNVLECTLTVFTLLAIYFLIKSLSYPKKQSYLFIFLSGIFVFLGVMCKGAVALFPFAFFPLHFLVYRNNFRDIILKTVLITASFSISFLIILQFGEAKAFFVKYIDNQIIKSILGFRVENMRESRFYILNALFKGIPVTLGICILILVAAFYTNKKRWILNRFHNKKSLFYFLLALSGSLPIMISLKQAGYYLVPSTPLFSIALALFISPSFLFLKEQLEKQEKNYKRFLLPVILLLIISIGLAFQNIGTIDKRDRDRINFVNNTKTLIPTNSTINIKSTKFQHSLHAFFQRKQFIALDTSAIHSRKFLIIEKEIDTVLLTNYVLRSELDDQKYNVYLKN
jgi:4-amino-4-deoxy-L-arabinose transferase-like glycosyltransferase